MEETQNSFGFTILPGEFINSDEGTQVKLKIDNGEVYYLWKYNF